MVAPFSFGGIMNDTKRAVCPSCRAEIQLGDDGKPISHDVAHFDVHNAEPETPETPEPPAAPETPNPDRTEEPEPTGFFDRLDRNLNRLLED